MEKLLEPPHMLFVTGGIAASDALCQRLADLYALPVTRPAACEATARGTAYLCAGSLAAWPGFDDAQEFSPQDNPALQDRYMRWLASLQAALAAYA